MFIKVEPADFFMFRVIMTFDLNNPDSEDQDVRNYMTEHDLEPRHTSEGEFESRHCQFMSLAAATWATTCKTSPRYNESPWRPNYSLRRFAST